MLPYLYYLSFFVLYIYKYRTRSVKLFKQEDKKDMNFEIVHNWYVNDNIKLHNMSICKAKNIYLKLPILI